MGTNIYKLYLEIIINLVKNTPNDQELGEKLRILYNTIIAFLIWKYSH